LSKLIRDVLDNSFITSDLFLKMTRYLIPVTALFACVALSSCVIPQRQLSAEENADSQDRIRQIEDEGYSMRDRERRSAARALGDAGVRAPSVNYHQHQYDSGSYRGY
jgi:hypothetical protein